MARKRRKKGSFHFLGDPKCPRINFATHNFDPRHFVNLEEPKWLAMGAKWAYFTC